VEFPGEDLGDGRLAEPGVGVDHRGALDLVAVLPVGFRDVVEVLVERICGVRSGPRLACQTDRCSSYSARACPDSLRSCAVVSGSGRCRGGAVTNSSQPDRVDSE
jgi:hypothetical protein